MVTGDLETVCFYLDIAGITIPEVNATPENVLYPERMIQEAAYPIIAAVKVAMAPKDIPVRAHN